MLRTDLDGRYTTAYPKLRGLGTALISFAGLTSLDVSRNCLASFDGLASLSQLQRLNYYFNNRRFCFTFDYFDYFDYFNYFDYFDYHN